MGVCTTLLNPNKSQQKFDGDDDEMQEEVMTCFKAQAADFCDSGTQKLFPRLNKCLDNAGDYAEKIKLYTANSFIVPLL
jgi:hypothetical protein